VDLEESPTAVDASAIEVKIPDAVFASGSTAEI
jgi:hypothetical protein